jgi:hypothetical protein
MPLRQNMESHPIERTTESMFSEAATAKMLQEWCKNGDLHGLYNAALLLNAALHQQRTMTKWLAGEAARNLGKPELEDELIQDAILMGDP